MHNLLPGALETSWANVEDGAGSRAESSRFRGRGAFTETLPPDEAGDSGRGGGGVEAAEEVEVSYVENQGGRASAEDGDSESGHERNDDGEENGDGDGYDSVSVDDESDTDDVLSDTAWSDEVLSDGPLSRETLSEGAWCDEDQQPVPSRQVPAPPRSPLPVGLQKQRSASQAVAAVLESSTVLPRGPGSASRGCGSTSGRDAAVDYLCSHDLEASPPRRVEAEPSQTGPATPPPTPPAGAAVGRLRPGTRVAIALQCDRQPHLRGRRYRWRGWWRWRRSWPPVRHSRVDGLAHLDGGGGCEAAW